jgi:DNA-binding NtrC family response regulator
MCLGVPGGGTVRTILLVDDDAIVSKIIGAILERAGFKVLVASDAEAAMVLAEQHAIEVLISDIQMPGISGEQLANILSTMRPQIKVLLISAAPESPVHLRDGWIFLRKPFPPAVLLEKLAEFPPA